MLVKVLVATGKCTINEARMAVFVCVPARAGEFSDNDVQLACNSLTYRQPDSPEKPGGTMSVKSTSHPLCVKSMRER